MVVSLFIGTTVMPKLRRLGQSKIACDSGVHSVDPGFLHRDPRFQFFCGITDYKDVT